MRISNRHPMVLIRAVTVLSFGLMLMAQSLVCPVAESAVKVTDVDVRDFSGRNTAFAGANLATMDILSEAQKIAAVEAAEVDIVAAPEETESVEVQEETPALEENPDVILLARLIQAEAGGISNINEQAAVALTVLYRCDSPRWPDTVSGNIYKANQYADPSGSYSEGALEAAVLAYTLWSEGRGGEILPSDCLSFFGNGSHNYFYDSGRQIYNMPGVPMPSDIYDQMTQIIPALRRSAEQENVEVAENSEPVTESINEDVLYNPSDIFADSTQSKTTEISNNKSGVSQTVEDELSETLSSDESSVASEIPSDDGN
ncbi:hypothetical protein IKW75_00890 [Candidatus Saccharibacteria bacterium]|nr:hypothetical protein [Candidatus Saccharibacteria bacterium]